MDSASRHARCERFIEAFADLPATLGVRPGDRLVVEAMGLGVDPLCEQVVRTVRMRPQDGFELELIDGCVVFDPEEPVEDLNEGRAELLAMLLRLDIDVVRQRLRQANLLPPLPAAAAAPPASAEYVRKLEAVCQDAARRLIEMEQSTLRGHQPYGSECGQMGRRLQAVLASPKQETPS